MKKMMVVLLVAALSVNAYADLKAWWAFEEGSGDYAYDSSAYGNTGLLVADTVSGNDSDPLPGSTKPDWIAGVNGGALQFCSGTDNYNSVWVAKSDSIRNLGGSWSMSMWLRQDSRAGTPGGGSGYARVISCPNYEVELGVSGWEYDYFWPYGTGAFQTDIGTSYIGAGGSTGQWYLMTVTYDGTDLKKYLNGTLVPNSVKNIPNQGINDIWSDAGKTPYSNLPARPGLTRTGSVVLWTMWLSGATATLMPRL